MEPVASIIVPTRNRAASLARTLQSLCAQHLQAGYQLLVVDNGPTDETRRVAQEAIAAHPQQMIQYIQEPVPGLLSGRHRGALEAKSDLLIFVDDDIEAKPGWLAAFLDSFRDPTVQLVGGPSLPSYEGQPPDWLGKFWIETPSGGKMCTWLSLIDLGDREMVVDPTYVLGLNLGIRRSALFAAGGFHPDCIPDHLQHWQGDGETGLALKFRKLGFVAVYQPRALVRHRIPTSRLSVEYFERRGYYQGVCDSYTKIRATAFAPAGTAEACSFSRWRLTPYIKSPVGYAGSVLRQLRCSWTEDRDVANIRKRVGRAYNAGFKFHQAAARRHPEVLEWILREDYWDYRLPELQ
jgi:glucosyl-dolichyl phosphate glucuronosyltransferase